MENKTAWISLGVFIAILVIGAVLLSRQNVAPPVTESPTPTARPIETESPDEEVDKDEELSELIIEGDEFSFSPSTETVAAGEIEITFENAGTVGHDLVFEDINAGTQVIEPGESETIRFIIEEPGTYTFYCSVNGHRQLGMEGELVVE